MLAILLSLVKAARYDRAERTFRLELEGGYRVRVEGPTPTIPPAPRGIIEAQGAEVIPFPRSAA